MISVLDMDGMGDANRARHLSGRIIPPWSRSVYYLPERLEPGFLNTSPFGRSRWRGGRYA